MTITVNPLTTDVALFVSFRVNMLITIEKEIKSKTNIHPTTSN